MTAADERDRLKRCAMRLQFACIALVYERNAMQCFVEVRWYVPILDVREVIVRRGGRTYFLGAMPDVGGRDGFWSISKSTGLSDFGLMH